MHQPSSNKSRSALRAASGLLLVHCVASFAAPRPAAGGVPLVRRARGTGRSRRRPRGADATRLAALPPYLGSLRDVAAHPQLFPGTGEHMRTLARRDAEEGGAAPSAEEFLTQLSDELLRAARNEGAAFATSAPSPAAAAASVAADPASDDRSNGNHRAPWLNVAAATAPAFASALGMGAAVTTYASAASAGSVPGNTNVEGDGVASESFLAWHKAQGGASNALRDLASSIPRDDGLASQLQLDASDASAHDCMNGGASDYYLGHAGGYYHTVADTAVLGQQAVDFANGFDAAGPYAPFGDAAAAVGPASGGGGLRELAAAIPTEEAGAGGSSGLDAARAVAAAMETPPVAEAVTQAAALPDANNELSDALSSRLSDLSYQGLQFDGKAPAVPPPSAKPPFLGDFMKRKLEAVELPKYHVDPPTISNPFSAEAPPSLENVASSIKGTAALSQEKLEGAVGALAHTFAGLNAKVAHATASFEGLSARLTEAAGAGASGVKAVGTAVQSGASKMAAARATVVEAAAPASDALPDPTLPDGAVVQSPAMPAANWEPPTFPEWTFPARPHLPDLDHLQPPTLPEFNIREGAAAAVERVNDASLADFGSAVLSAIHFTGGILLKFLDLVLAATAGTSTSSILSNVHASVTATMDSASHTVVSTLTDLGNLTLLDILQSLIALVLVVSDIVLKLLNAVVYLLSGQDGAAWTLQASSSVDAASSQLLARATATYDDVTHASMAELARTVGEYGGHVGNEFVTLIGSLQGTVDGLSFDGVSVPQDTLDSVATAVQTALSL